MFVNKLLVRLRPHRSLEQLNKTGLALHSQQQIYSNCEYEKHKKLQTIMWVGGEKVMRL